MIVKLDSVNVYTIGNYLKTVAYPMSIEGPVNCNGNITVEQDNNQITDTNTDFTYSIACRGNVSLKDGLSGKDIYHTGNATIDESWNTNEYEVIKFNALPGFQESHDIIGYLKYLLSLPSNGTASFDSGNGRYTLNGSFTKSINVFELDPLDVGLTTLMKLGTKSNSTSLIKLDSHDENVMLDSMTFQLNCTSEDIIFAIDATNVTIRDCNIQCTIYAPNSTVYIENSTVNGAIYANNIEVIGGAVIEHSPFIGYIKQPVTPSIKVSPLSSVDNFEPVNVSVLSDEGPIPSYYEIRYTLDGSEPTRSSELYTSEFSLYSHGLVTVKAKIFGNGVDDGDVASQAYLFKCKTTQPELIRTLDSMSGLTTYTITHEINSTVYYTLDGSTPSIYSNEYDPLTFNDNFNVEGFYSLRFIAYVEGCETSDLVEEDILVELPITGLNPPRIKIHSTVSGVKGALVYTVPTSTLTGVVEIPGTFTIENAKKLAVYIEKYNSSDVSKVKYTIDGKNPVSGIEYVYDTPIYIDEISFNPLRAFSSIEYTQFSKQLNLTFTVNVSDNTLVDSTNAEQRSWEVLDTIQGGSSYAVDIAWVGPGVITDDFVVYQSLINILATDMFERIFNPRFGVSISAKLAEINAGMNPTQIISDLKYEIESQDPRILINDEMSDVYFDESIGALVVDLLWTNLVTKNSATVKYAYDLDTVK